MEFEGSPNRVGAVFMDRDGVVNELVVDPRSGRSESPLSVEDVSIYPGAPKQIARLRDAGWFVVCVTNQPSAAKGSILLETLRAIHSEVRSQLAAEGGDFDADRICLHHPEGTVAALGAVCDCRKPQPGMLFDAAAEYDIDLGRSWMIGDTDADVQAGRAAGVRTVLVETTGSAHKRSTPDEADVVVAELGEAVDAILSIDPARSEDT